MLIIFIGLSAKQKHNITTNFRCPTCGKIYLGLVRMAQHFDKYPDHGSAEYLKTLQNAHSETEGGTGSFMCSFFKNKVHYKFEIYVNNICKIYIIYVM